MHALRVAPRAVTSWAKGGDESRYPAILAEGETPTPF